MSEPIELVIFDCDGVLVDSERLAIRIDSIVLTEMGWPLSEAEIADRFVGATEDYMITEVERHTGKALRHDWDARFTQMYRDVFAAELEPVDGIVEALGALRLPNCVASSGSHEKMRFTLGLTGLWDRFEGRIYSAEDVERGKPAPDLFLYAADQMGVDASQCIVVEDSRFGVEAGRAAGMRVLGYAGGVTRAEQLQGENTMIFHDMRDLPGLIATS